MQQQLPVLAICLRGKCIDTQLDVKTGCRKVIDARNTWGAIHRHIVVPNQKQWRVKVFAHGWVHDAQQAAELPLLFNASAHKFEQQRSFKSVYSAISVAVRSEIVRERFRHLPSAPAGADNYFESVLSYAYSISSSAMLVTERVDAFISIRHDAIPKQDVVISCIPREILTDAVANASPLFMGDFILCGDGAELQRLMDLYNWVTQLLTDAGKRDAFRRWTATQRKSRQPGGKYDHGDYANQCILSYFFSGRHRPVFACRI